MTRTTYYASLSATPLSKLNVRTNERYLRCLRSRKHRPGEEWTRPRPLPGGNYTQYPICANCGVPLHGKPVTWNGHL